VRHTRPTALNVASSALPREDRAEPDGQLPHYPGPPHRLVFAEIEIVGSEVGSLADLAEEALRLMSDQPDPVADILVAMRGSLSDVQLGIDAILGLEGVVDMTASSPNSYSRSGGRHSPPCPLTSRETEILICLADGMVYKEIARELSLTTSTVRSHLHHIYHKLGVADRAQAVLLATRRGWI
jgi:DNA-binding CsgD family transcriptional regulator